MIDRRSGRAMLEALVHGTTDAQVLADLARGRLRKKLPALHQALAARFRPHHAFLVSQLLAHVDYLEEAISMVSEEVEGRAGRGFPRTPLMPSMLSSRMRSPGSGRVR